MRSLLSLVSVATVAAAAAPAAEVFILDPAIPNSAPPQLSRDVARLVLSHRLSDAPDEAGPAILGSVQFDTYVNAFGKPRQSLFSSLRTLREPQLVVLVEGATSATLADVRAALDYTGPAFTILDPPSQSANHNLLEHDFVSYTGSWIGPNSCPVNLAIQPDQSRCWSGDSLIVKYDAIKDPEDIAALASSIPQLQNMAKYGVLETTLIMIPESSRNSEAGAWAPQNTPKLGRRQDTETVMQFSTASLEGPDSPEATLADIGLYNQVPIISSGHCFAGRSACMNNTFGCFRHGECQETKPSCWKCSCGSSKDKYGIETVWTGGMCQKADVSTEFWMFLGVGIVGLLSVGGALSLLVGVGNEPLPGVLGAGVVKSK